MRRVPFHPLLLAIFPVLFLFAANAERVHPGKVLLPLLVTVAVAVAVAIAATIVLRDVRRGAVAASGLMFLALSYGHVWTALADKSVFGFVFGRDLVLFPLWTVLAVAIVLAARRMRWLDEATAVLNSVGIALLVLVAFNTSSAVANQKSAPFSARVGELSNRVPLARDGRTHRDILYLVLEDLGSADVLKRYYGVDQRPFYRALERRGFFIADDALANYPHTAQSVAASLNMQYLDDLGERYPHSGDWRPLYRELVGPKVTRFLQHEGYRYAHIGSWWDPTASDPTAQINYHYDRRSEFTRVLLRTTILQPIAKRIGFLKELDGRAVAHKQILFQFDSILDASKLPGPTFTFAHVMLPHEPMTFDRRGGYVTEARERSERFESGYAEQVRYADRKVIELIDELFAVPVSERPIVVMVSDEGPKDLAWPWGLTRSWAEAPDEVLRRKFPIQSAYYFPGLHRTGLYPSITPVNSFRLLFDAYFGTDLGLLPDKEFAFGADVDHELYDFVDVTDRLHSHG